RSIRAPSCLRNGFGLYHSGYGDGGLWVRPAAMWTQEVNRDGYHGPRFIPVDTD
ncbi:MAG: DUF1653 domain-containing protein, partial [Oscillospiraceae bacterium]|nr:DUF1653 domain-containing protein [Oscillospiraceae bacterium]